MDETTNPVMGSGEATPASGAPHPDAASTHEADAPDHASVAPELDADGNPVQPEPEDDSEEVEHEGQKYRLPKALKPLLMMQSDYTRKTQEVAETRRALEERQQQFQQQAQAVQENIRDYARLTALDEQLAQYQQVNWQALEAEDPIRAGQLFRQMSLLRDQRAGLAQQLAAKEQQRSEETQRERAKRLQEAEATLAREIKGWGPDLKAKLAEFSEKQGFTRAELAGVDDPRVIKILHAAYVGAELLQKQLAAARAAAPQTPAKPVPTVGGKGQGARPDPARMSMDDYAAWRRKGNG